MIVIKERTRAIYAQLEVKFPISSWKADHIDLRCSSLSRCNRKSPEKIPLINDIMQKQRATVRGEERRGNEFAFFSCVFLDIGTTAFCRRTNGRALAIDFQTLFCVFVCFDLHSNYLICQAITCAQVFIQETQDKLFRLTRNEGAEWA